MTTTDLAVLPRLDFETAALFALALVIAVLLTIALAPAGSPATRRLRRRIAQAQRTGRPEPTRTDAELPTSLRRSESADLFAPLGRRITSLIPRAETLRERLIRAGLSVGVGDLSVGAAIGGLAVAGGLHLGLDLPLVVAVCAGIIASTGLPHVFISMRIARRTKRFVALMADAVDLITRGIKSGLPVAEALHSIGQEMAEPVGGVFREVTGNLRLGMTIDEALWIVARRLQIPEFKFFVISVSIQQETGGNLAEILQNLSQMIRRREQVKLKIKAMSSEARASAMIIGSLPFIMSVVIYIVNPDYIMQLFVDPRGWLLVGAGLTSMTLGLAVIAKMVRFEI
jgi:tight adherence protein B